MLDELFLALLKKDRQKVAVRFVDTKLFITYQDRMFLRNQVQKSGLIYSPVFASPFPSYYVLDNCQGSVCSNRVENQSRYSLFTLSKDFNLYFPKLSMVPSGYGTSDPLSYPHWISVGFNKWIIKDFEKDQYLCFDGFNMFLGSQQQAAVVEFVPESKWPDNYSLMFG